MTMRGFAIALVFAASALLSSGCGTLPSASTQTGTPMRNPVGYFEIPVHDLNRAIAFYEAVFGYALERETIDGNAMALFPLHEDAPGITGALAQGESYVPGRQGARVYFAVDDIDATLRNAVAAGGSVHYPKTAIGEYGWVAEFLDSEGNIVALHAK